MEQVEGCYGCRMLGRRVADAQATIAALEETILKMGENAAVVAKDAMAAKEQVAALQAERDEYKTMYACLTGETYDNPIADLKAQLTQRTAELEAANKRIHDLECQHQDLCLRNQILRDRPDLPVERASFHAEVVRMQAELERVRGELQSAEAGYFVAERELQGANNKYDELRTLIAALPKVEGEIMVSESLVLAEDPDMCSDMSDKEEATAYAALLKRRQGMEG